MNCCDLPILDLSQVHCREIAPQIETIRLYRRIPRKLKKIKKKLGVKYEKVVFNIQGTYQFGLWERQ